MHSHHSHSGQFCQHAKGSLEDVVLRAIQKGFQVFGLSEHVPRYRERDLYPEEVVENGLEILRRKFDEYLIEARRLRSKYSKDIHLLIGLETEYIHSGDLEEFDAFMAANTGKIDYIVGSVHHVREVPIDFDEASFQLAVAQCGGLESYFSAYFDAQYEMIARMQPAVIGHFDVCRLYVPETRFDVSPFEDVWKRIERNVQFAINYGACFEINAAAFRKGWKTAYPGEEILKLILERRGMMILSDDSHGPDAVGLNYGRLHQYLVQMKVVDLWYLEVMGDDGPARPQRYQGDWAQAPYWLTQV